MSLYDVVVPPTEATCDHDPPSTDRSTLMELTGLVVLVVGAVQETVFLVSELRVFATLVGAFGA